LCSLTEHGQNAEKGSHDALMVSSGRYADLYNTYFRHKSPVYISSQSWRLVLGDVAAD
jgi:hypothetical protein